MLPTTLDAIRAVLKSDPTVTPGDRAEIVTHIRNHGKTPTPSRASALTANRVMHRREVAERFGRSLRFVDSLARQGVLPRLKLPGRVRACGFRSLDVEKLLCPPEGDTGSVA